MKVANFFVKNKRLIQKSHHIKIESCGFIDKSVKFVGSGKVIISKNAEIRAYSVIEMGNGNLFIGERSVIGYGSFIQCTGDAYIGNGTLIGPNCSILTSSHPINEHPLVDQELIRGDVLIQDNVWIGSNCVIGINTEILQNSIIGCNSFVNKNIPANEVWGGTPIKFIRKK
jgi:acetyltransferase-like isoleucine patch superfamily enzyme